MRARIRFLAATALAAAAVTLPATARAADPAYPSGPVTIVLPFPTGGITDNIARLLAGELSTAWKQTVVVENRPGASGMIGAGVVARAPKDGHTALFTITTHVQLPSLHTKMPYDSVKDFAPVSLIALSQTVLAVGQGVPVDSVKGLVDKLKTEPGRHPYGSYGTGTTGHIYGELFRRQAGVEMPHVPYKGGAPLVADLLGGHVGIAFVDVGTSMQHLKSGRLKPLGIIGTKRSDIFPTVPTFQELGYKGFEPYGWMGLFLPAGTPNDRVEKLSAEVDRILKRPDIVKKLHELNLQPMGGTPAQFAENLRRDGPIWKEVIELGGVKLDQ
ncbi:Bug family tripartite tricarboxylate transporter substrate binding protein [Quisquiliibacterium transsilvanicum]|uniref:Tripartite-type tricarboxylate transporter receptor subunit TctC n=1 Tax=Quisquiliibacterium transsilvanicum TaxID=1549638 RepID=A0A7W8M965_9BURK|nr:tripartite tricarboxylate transporter substrate binding protein [Quisquiliibacterium transsilvanicum]MBB5271739.1 tripartite-type tricarboxylate transporter receptor subunit TctC [Quisquiliibacterium transsilvanicum]